MKYLNQLKELVAVKNREGKLSALIMACVGVMVIVTVIYALWTGGLRAALESLINDTNFTATYGAGIGNAMYYLLDLVPLATLFAGLAALFILIGAILKNPGKELGV